MKGCGAFMARTLRHNPRQQKASSASLSLIIRNYNGTISAADPPTWLFAPPQPKRLFAFRTEDPST
jgi:hypothetical protein